MKILYFYAHKDGHYIVEDTGDVRRVLSEDRFVDNVKMLHDNMFDFPKIDKGPYGNLLYAIEWVDLMTHAILNVITGEEDGWRETTLTKDELMPVRSLITAIKKGDSL